MTHHHHHHHEHRALESSARLNKAFTIGILINLLYVGIELLAGFWYNSMALIADAGHNLTDVASLALAMMAFSLAGKPSTSQFTYGYRKSTILVSLINSVILFVAIGAIIWESFHRINQPVVIEGIPIAITAGIGIVINAVSALLFFKDQSHDLNVRGAYLHLMADAAVSLGVVVSGLLILFFGLYWIDLVMSLVVVGVIFYSTWHLFKDSLFLALDGVPKDIQLSRIETTIGGVDGVEALHHLHVWAISTSQNALTAHIVVATQCNMERLADIRHRIKEALQKENIQHATLEFETAAEHCADTHTNNG